MTAPLAPWRLFFLSMSSLLLLEPSEESVERISVSRALFFRVRVRDPPGMKFAVKSLTSQLVPEFRRALHFSESRTFPLLSMSSFNPFGNDRISQNRSESRDAGRSDVLSGLTSRLPFPTSTLQPPQAAANLISRIPDSMPTSQESHGQPAVPQNVFPPDDDVDARRASDLSERTLYDKTEDDMQRSLNRVSLSSYQHPNDIQSPRRMYSGSPPRSGARRRYGPKASLEDPYIHGEGGTSPSDSKGELPRHRGVVSNLLELSRVSNSTLPWDDYGFPASRRESLGEPLVGGERRPSLSRLYSLGGYDADDPKITGATRELLDDPADLERNVKEQMDLRSMSYKQRRKEAQKIKIRFFVTCMLVFPRGIFEALTLDCFKPSSTASNL
jgi:hypothetical protein